MDFLTRFLGAMAAAILEVTVVYANATFADLIGPEIRFWAFVLVTMFTIWRTLELAKAVVPLTAPESRKLWKTLGLTLFRQSVFSQFCYRKDG